MAVFLFDLFAILVFWRFADRSRLRELLPLVLFASFLRFLEHFILIDWTKTWTVCGPYWRTLWLPISADVTVWPTAVYFYFQYLPERRKFLYTLAWGLVMMLYLQALIWLKVFTRGEHWHTSYSFGLVLSFFGINYLVWRWLRQIPGGVVQHES